MIELAEPLFELNKEEEKQGGDMIETKKKDTGPVMIGGVPCENCQLHFIRCIKPNEAKLPDLFIHAMTLQQVTYMGVLESVDLKQKNFPYRKNYEEFYARYELLSPIYGKCRYDNMDKGAYDFRELSVSIVKITLQEFGKEYYALGTTKIFMMLEVVALFDKAIQKMVTYFS
jgi:myosin heavy subunit